MIGSSYIHLALGCEFLGNSCLNFIILRLQIN